MSLAAIRQAQVEQATKAQAHFDARRQSALKYRETLTQHALSVTAKPAETVTEALEQIDVLKAAFALKKEQEARDSIFAPPVTITPVTISAPVSTPAETVIKLTTQEPKEKKAKKASAPKAEKVVKEKKTSAPKAVKEKKVVEPKAVKEKKAPAPKATKLVKEAKPKERLLKDIKSEAYELFAALGHNIHTTKEMRDKKNNLSNFVLALNLTRKADWKILCERLHNALQNAGKVPVAKTA